MIYVLFPSKGIPVERRKTSPAQKSRPSSKTQRKGPSLENKHRRGRAPKSWLSGKDISLAEDRGDRAMGIILSGTGSDGTMGIKAVHGAGGLTLIQDPESAKYDGMPRSAAGTGLADYVLPPEKMAESLVEYVKRFPAGKPTTFVRRAPTSVHRILNLLHTNTGQDFSLYKKNTLYRRIERRMGLHQIEDAHRYVDYLQAHPEEIWSLFKELLIRVTSFFRDPEAFEALKEKILPRILENQPLGTSLRVWVPGCSTGEEAYSIAIVIREFLEENKTGVKLQVFG
jgi:two-component system, chemotaxis family, CheB/CheR fusion protein